MVMKYNESLNKHLSRHSQDNMAVTSKHLKKPKMACFGKRRLYLFNKQTRSRFSRSTLNSCINYLVNKFVSVGVGARKINKQKTRLQILIKFFKSYQTQVTNNYQPFLQDIKIYKYSIYIKIVYISIYINVIHIQIILI